MDKALFFNAIRNGDIATVKDQIAANKKYIELTDERGSTPLILASYYNQVQLVNFLIEKGVLIDGQDGSGNTALMGVCFKGFKETAVSLIKAGANVNQKNAMGGTCLIYAVTFGHVEIAKILLENGADKTLKDARGSTALDHAKKQESDKLIALLTTPN